MTRTKEFREWIANPNRIGREWDHKRNRPMTEAEVKEAELRSNTWGKFHDPE